MPLLCRSPTRADSMSALQIIGRSHASMRSAAFARPMCIIRIVGLTLCGLLVCGVTVWGALALHYSDLHGALGSTLATAFALCGLLALVALGARRWRWRALG